MISYLVIMLVAGVATYLAVPLVRMLAMRVGALTPLRSRDVHASPTPRLGGVAMLIGVSVAFVVAGATPFLHDLFYERRGAWGILAAAGFVCLIGAIDDIFDLDALTKFSGQVLAAVLMAWQGVQLVSLPLGGVTVGSGGMFLVLTVLVVVATMNAVNFVDGLDGLAAGVVGIGASAFFVYTYLLSREASPLDYSSLGSVVSAALVGCCLGFLPHNFHPARIFMGDSGALLLGLLLAASAVAVTGQVDPAAITQVSIAPAFFPVLLPIVVVLVPMVDLCTAVVRRLARGQSPLAADRQHLHHRLLDLGHSHPHAVWVMYLWTATMSFGAVLIAFVPWRTLLPYWIGAIALTAVLTVGPHFLRGRRDGARDGS